MCLSLSWKKFRVSRFESDLVMEIWVVTFDNQVDTSKMFLRKEDAETCLKVVLDGRTYDRIPRVKQLIVREIYDSRVWDP
jgi:hypothetical protein